MEEGGSAYIQRSYPSRKRVSVACQTDNTYTPSGTIPGPVLGSRQRPIVSGILGTSGPIKRPADRDPNPQIKANVPGNPTSSSAEPTSSRNNVSQPTTEDGTLRVTIQHFSKMTDTLCSPSKRIKGVPWRIMVMPKQHMVQKKSQKCMGFFLQCCPDTTYSEYGLIYCFDNEGKQSFEIVAWTCQAVAEMRLIAQKPGVQNFVRKTTHVYTAKENDWGYSCFMTWADVLDESQGYIKDDRVTLEITVKSEAPKNMLSREDFRRSIDQWYNLAEMQISRGQVDLSIEANAQALKFCKDKDKLSRDKLEAQRERLVNHKLLESIQRIEKGKETPKSTEALKPTSLRQALTGAQKTLTSTKTGAKGGSKKDRRAATVQQMKKKKAETKYVTNYFDLILLILLNIREDILRNSDVKRKSTEWEDDRSNSLDSEERKTDSSPATPAEIVHETNVIMMKIRHPSGDLGKLLDDGSSDNSSDYGEDGIRDLCESCASNHHAQHRSSLSSLDDGDERIMVEMCENFCQTEDSGDMIVPMPSALQAAAAVAAAVPRLPQLNSGTSRERRNAGSSPNESAFRQNVARMAEATDDVIDKIIRSRDCDLGEKMSEIDHERLIQFCVKHFGIENSVSRS
uniref:MATH domain-containing protein n=1 Tax=Heterorhabditis bacteriophora TaxID=37862 RepID=A0A1I7XBZ5_HETBA